MGAVPLLTREGEVDLARRMERGKLRMQKAISRSALVQGVVVDLADQLKKGGLELESFVDWEMSKRLPADLKVAPKRPSISPMSCCCTRRCSRSKTR
jgi:RNA polymerase primary sigma factor